MPQRARRCIWHVHTDAPPRISEARWPCRITCKACTHGGFHARAAHRARHAAGSPRPRGPHRPQAAAPPAGRQSAGHRAYGVPSVRDRAGEWRLPPGAQGPTIRGRAPPCASTHDSTSVAIRPPIGSQSTVDVQYAARTDVQYARLLLHGTATGVAALTAEQRGCAFGAALLGLIGTGSLARAAFIAFVSACPVRGAPPTLELAAFCSRDRDR